MKHFFEVVARSEDLGHRSRSAFRVSGEANNTGFRRGRNPFCEICLKPPLNQADTGEVSLADLEYALETGREDARTILHDLAINTYGALLELTVRL